MSCIFLQDPPKLFCWTILNPDASCKTPDYAPWHSASFKMSYKMIHTTCSSTHAHTSFLPFNRKVCKSSECCGFKIYVWEWFKECAHVLRGVLFVQLILLWSSSRSSTRGPTVVLAFSSILLSIPLQFPVSSPYAKILLPPRCLSCCDFPLLVQVRAKYSCIFCHSQTAGNLERVGVTQVKSGRY